MVPYVEDGPAFVPKNGTSVFATATPGQDGAAICQFLIFFSR
jgi:hypothetical protein